MVWIGMSSKGLTKPIFVEPGAKIHQVYYQEKILRPMKKEARQLYPSSDFVFHQDSAPTHTAKTTLKWLQTNKIHFIPPEKWMPSSPDAAPCDYFLWEVLKIAIK